MGELPYLGAVIIATILAPYLHEGTHWLIGWLGDTNPDTQWVFWVIPNGVKHEKIETVDLALIRFSGLAIFLWLPAGFVALVYFLLEWTPGHLFAALVPLFVVFMATEADAIAMRDPEKYREMEIEADLPRNPLFLPNNILPERIPRF